MKQPPHNAPTACSSEMHRISLSNAIEPGHEEVLWHNGLWAVNTAPVPLMCGAHNLLEPHVLDGVSIIYGISGAGRVKINLSEYNAQAGDIYVLSPNSIVQVLDEEEEIFVRIIFVSIQYLADIGMSETLHHLSQMTHLRPYLHPDPHQWTELLSACQYIAEHLGQPDEGSQHLVRAYLTIIVQRLAQLYTLPAIDVGTSTTNHHEQLYRRFLSLLYEHYQRERSITFYASALHLTPKYFARIIRQVSGRAPLDLINEMVISAAQVLLRGTSLTVAQISDELHFPNKSFFGTYFRRHVGMTPLDYRRASSPAPSDTNDRPPLHP